MDKRVKRTTEKLEKALLKLMKTKNIKKISVKELCDSAGINRGTFYLHYDNIFDILQSTQNKMINEFENNVSKYNNININLKVSDFEHLLNDIFNFFDKNSEICMILASDNGDNKFEAKLHDIFYSKMSPIKNILEEKDQIFFKYYYLFFVSGATTIILEWLKNGKKESPKKMTSLTLNTINLFNKIPK